MKDRLMKRILTSLLYTSVFVLSSCSINNANIGYGGQPTGVVYSDYRTPGSIANSSTKPLKSGTACTQGLFWLAAWGDAGTDDAMKEGGITKIANVQYSNKSVLSGFYSKYCTIVTGE